VLETLFVAALLSVTDPAGDVGTNLTAPTAAALRQRDAFDLRSVTVFDKPQLSFRIGLENAAGFPGALLELYLGEARSSETPGAALLAGSALRLPSGASWRYAFRITKDEVRVFERQNGSPTDVTEASGARLSVSGNTLVVQTKLPVPKPLSVYGMSGSFDPFSVSGWRRVRTEPSPWGFSGRAASPVLDILTDSPGAQARALEQGVLPEVRAAASEPGWLALAGAGVAAALIGFGVRLSWGRQTEIPPAPYLAPFTKKDRRRRAQVLRDLSRVQGKLVLAEEQPKAAPEPASRPEPVLN